MSIINELLVKAVEEGASDIHMKEDAPPYFRLRGALVSSGFEDLDGDAMNAVIHDIMPEHAVKQYEETHEADFSLMEEGAGRFRVNIFDCSGIPAIVMRHINDVIPTCEELGLPPQIKELAHVHRGIILVCGTTGSGKSSTLASMINEMNTNMNRRIITIEDPIEYMFQDGNSIISQREVGLDTFNFSKALRAFMRQDPDVIMVGEMRDTVSFMAALQASETGHLVISTLHSATAAQSIHRILDMFPAEEQDSIRMSMASNMHAIVAQRLVPSIQGGREPAVEIMVNNGTVRKLLQKNNLEVLNAAIETGSDDGMQTFNQSVYNLIKSGLITESEGMKAATNPEALKMNLQGIFLDEGKRILAT